MQLYFKNTLYSYKTFATTIAQTCRRPNVPRPNRHRRTVLDSLCKVSNRWITFSTLHFILYFTSCCHHWQPPWF